MWSKEDMTLEEFWAPINGREQFWLDLGALPWAYELIDLVSEYTDDWHIVSSPSACDSSYNGKVKWLRGFFGANFDRFALTPHKYIFAREGAVLIDDRESNCQRFVFTEDGSPTGGLAILFPETYNSNHQFAGSPIANAQTSMPVAYVRQQLEFITRPDTDWGAVWKHLGIGAGG